jgi:hypothetical protein
MRPLDQAGARADCGANSGRDSSPAAFSRGLRLAAVLKRILGPFGSRSALSFVASTDT